MVKKDELMRIVQEDRDARQSAQDRRHALTKAIMNMRRQNLSVEEIAKQLGFDNGFDVIKILNEIHKPTPSIDVKVVRYEADIQIDDLVGAYKKQAMEGDLKAAEFIRKMMETKARIHGAITPPQLNVQIDNKRPWEKVYAATLSDTEEPTEQKIAPDKVVEGQIVEDEGKGEYEAWHTHS